MQTRPSPAETPSPPLPRAALHQAIQDRIKRFIIDHEYQPGDLMPSETELMRTLGISRGSLREAMKALQTLGVIETRHGHGTYVGRFSLDHLVDGLTFRIRSERDQSLHAVRELLELREILESSLVARVARRLSDDDFLTLNDLVSQMEARGARGEMFSYEDRAFHRALYRPLNNTLVVQLLEAFWDIFYVVRVELPGTAPHPELTARHHRQILEALMAGDAVAASTAMTEHFTGIQRWIGESDAAVASAGANR